MRKINKSLALAASALVLGVSLVACGGKGNDNGNIINNPLSFEKAYNTSVLSGIGLLNTSTAVAPISLLAEVTETTEAEAPSQEEATPETATPEEVAPEVKPNTNPNLDKLTPEFKKEIIDNLAIAQNTINGSGTMSEVVKSDKEGYESMYTITKKDINGNDIVYTFYYNELTSKDTEELDDEEKKIIEGIVINGDTEYMVRGKKEIEQDEEEDEFKIMVDDKNYVIIETEKEENETEYSYSKYVDNELVYETEVEYELNKDKEVELSFEALVNGEEVEYSYSFINKNNEAYIDVEIEKANSEALVVLKVVANEDGSNSYEFVDYQEEVNNSDSDNEAEDEE